MSILDVNENLELPVSKFTLSLNKGTIRFRLCSLQTTYPVHSNSSSNFEFIRHRSDQHGNTFLTEIQVHIDSLNWQHDRHRWVMHSLGPKSKIHGSSVDFRDLTVLSGPFV